MPASQNSASPKPLTLSMFIPSTSTAHPKVNSHSGASGSQYCKKLPAASTSITHTVSHIKQYSQPIIKDRRSPNASRIKSFILRFGYTIAISARAAITINSSKPAKM
ncbi:hypothetical protein D3C77_371930 [compost metagenome]